jgi:hypothetical protein
LFGFVLQHFQQVHSNSQPAVPLSQQHQAAAASAGASAAEQAYAATHPAALGLQERPAAAVAGAAAAQGCLQDPLTLTIPLAAQMVLSQHKIAAAAAAVQMQPAGGQQKIQQHVVLAVQ